MISQTISRLACLLPLISMFPGTALAETASTVTNAITVDTRGVTPTVLSYAGFSYEDNGTSITITGFTTAGNLRNLYIPSSIAGKPVTAIADGAFSDTSSLESITLPSGLTNLGSNAFSGAANLETATFQGNAPTVVGSGAFSGTAGNFNVRYYGTSAGFSSPTWEGYPSQVLVASTDVFDNVSLSMNERQGLMEISFDYLSSTLSGSPGKGNVRVDYSLDGEDWQETKSSTDAVGSQVSAGRGIRIQWNYAAEGILTDPALDTSIYVRLSSEEPSAAVEVTTPIPLRNPTLPVRVNLCFGHEAPFSFKSPILRRWFRYGDAVAEFGTISPASNAFSPEQQLTIRSETEAIFTTSGISPESLTIQVGSPQIAAPDKHAIDVYFTPSALEDLYAGALSLGGDGTNRFRETSNRGVVLVGTSPENIPEADHRKYQEPRNIAEVIAHEISHNLGMPHIEQVARAQDAIMDYRWMFSNGSPEAANCNTEPRSLKSDESLAGLTHNEAYYLQRWVDGIRRPKFPESEEILVGGSYDINLEPRGTSVRRSNGFLSLATFTGTVLYNARIFYATGLPGVAAVKQSIVDANHPLQLDLQTQTPIQILASSTLGGDADILIIPESQIEPDFYEPVQGEALKILKFDESSVSTVIGSGMTGEITYSPIMPQNLSVEPVGFDGSHVQIDFPAEAGYLYTVERSEDCSTWTAVPELTKIPGAATAPLCLIHNNGGSKDGSVFYRLLVEIPPSP